MIIIFHPFYPSTLHHHPWDLNTFDVAPEKKRSCEGNHHNGIFMNYQDSQIKQFLLWFCSIIKMLTCIVMWDGRDDQLERMRLLRTFLWHVKLFFPCIHHVQHVVLNYTREAEESCCEVSFEKYKLRQRECCTNDGKLGKRCNENKIFLRKHRCLQ